MQEPKGHEIIDPLKQERDRVLGDLNFQASDPRRFIKQDEEFLNVMFNDMTAALEISNQYPESETWRRIVVRLSFSALDSYCWALKKLFYFTLRWRSIAPSQKDLEYITGINEKYRRFRPTPTENVKYIVSRLATLSTVEWKIGDESKEWQAFCTSVLVRHRITHPRRLDDLKISPDEYDKIADSLIWFQNGLDLIVKGILASQPE